MQQLEWPKSETLITWSGGSMWSNRNSHTLLIGTQNGTLTLEESFVVSKQIKIKNIFLPHNQAIVLFVVNPK